MSEPKGGVRVDPVAASAPPADANATTASVLSGAVSGVSLVARLRALIKDLRREASLSLTEAGYHGQGSTPYLVAVAWARAEKNHADRLEAALGVSEPPAGWQPIETAPKDGTEILLWMGGSALPRVRVGLWINEGIYPSTWRCDGHHFKAGLITHWMPLPDPPKVEP